MPDSLNVTILDPKTEMHIGDLNILHINIQNIDTENIVLKDLICMPDAGMTYVMPDKYDEITVLKHEYPATWFSDLLSHIRLQAKSTAQVTIGLDKIPPLQPGNDVSLTFPVKVGGIVRKAIDEGVYTIVFVVKYTKKDPDVQYSKVVSKDITVNNHLGVMILGGVVGGLLGALYRGWNAFSPTTSSCLPIPYLNILSQLGFGAVMGFIIVIVLQRKSGVQSFVSINDFWGGLLGGFIISAGGSELLNTYINTNSGSMVNTTATLVSNTTI